MKAILTALVFFFAVSANADVSQTYRFRFQADFGRSANNVKQEVLEALPGIYSRYTTDVKWQVTRNGNGFFDVKFRAKTAARIEGWINTLVAVTQDAIADVRRLD
ncbi:MAG TPA: hypothetical protein VFV50_18505 [Bdellovibrionales bacterium]|nr:hypothetical protein [Bdellovibrionales bacterium]